MALAYTYHNRGELEQAEPLYLQGFQLLGNTKEDKIALAFGYTNLAEVKFAQNNISEATEYSRKSLSAFEEVLKPNDSYIGIALNNLGTYLIQQENYEEAKECYERALPILSKSLSYSNDISKSCLKNLTYVYQKLGKKN